MPSLVDHLFVEVLDAFLHPNALFIVTTAMISGIFIELDMLLELVSKVVFSTCLKFG